ncbi:Carbon monoxide dehydrogenase subunit G [Andreprevotia lacus DSM 23236]|uniref:Carbon monoxide dehydrogenase subunit G n=2 Tax=Andreprevotia TaxID=397275 RepID=A0A1W1XQV9_9NEIS|nr:Carbon monoxide dehydrogenase subunit G [Andreprevotia lacus DSM 23236]
MVAAQADNPPVQVDAKRDGDKVLISASFTADVPKELVWQVMIDFDHMAEFMPRLAQSRVVQREGDRLTVNQHGSVHVGFFDIPFDSTREIQLKPPGELDSRAIGGNNGPMQSVATLTQQGRQTVISYHAEWQPTSGFMASLGVDLIKSQLGEQFGAMRQEMLRRAARNSSQTAAIP